MHGCPVSVAEHVLSVARVGRTKNPCFDPAIVLPFVISAVSWRIRSLFRRPLGQPCQRRLEQK